jgi:hypothetical protein
MIVPNRAEQYRRLAQECWRLAQMIPADARASLLEMAQVWQRLADEQDHATVPQQQQQAQPKDDKKE